jgi:hypothetical protein
MSVNSVFSIFFTALLVFGAQLQATEVNLCLQVYNPTLKRTVNEFRMAMVKQNLHLEVTSLKDREEFITARNQPKSDNRIAVEFENSKLKYGNDVIKDKDLITSLDHFANHYILKRIERWANDNLMAGVTIKRYSDGKSLSLIIDSPKEFSERQIDDLDLVFEQFQIDLVELFREKKVIRTTDQIETWFRMGVGRTTDEAYFSARVSRKLAGPTEVIHYSKPIIKKKLANLLYYAEYYREQISSTKELWPLLEQDFGSKKYIPSQKFFDILRKASSPSEIQTALEEHYQIKLESIDPAALFSYAEIIDLLNPKFFVVDQSVVTLSEAHNGGIVVDRKGMGSANQVATAKAVALALPSTDYLLKVRNENELHQDQHIEQISVYEDIIVTDFLSHNRKEEEKVTAEINIYRKRMETEWGAKCRGDDCVILGLPDDIQAFLNHELVKGQRIVFVSAGIAESNARSEISTHGEAIEKLFVKHFSKQISTNLRNLSLDSFTFAIHMTTKEMGKGAVSLYINPVNGLRPTPDQAATIRNCLKDALAAFNLEQKGQHKDSSYTDGMIFTF